MGTKMKATTSVKKTANVGGRKLGRRKKKEKKKFDLWQSEGC